MQPTIELLIGLVAGVVLAVLATMIMRARAISTARNKFGSEYGRAVEEAGSRHKAAALLHEREKRVVKFKLHEISGDARDAFDVRWARARASFVDSPLGAVSTTDALLDDVLTTRGYPQEKFEQRVADISVHHADLVDKYRSAHEFAQREDEQHADTEDLRQAMLSYKVLYEAVVGPTPHMAEEETKAPVVEESVADEMQPVPASAKEI